MIGSTGFDILCVFYCTMLGLIWMLVDSVYHIIKPQENSEDNNTNPTQKVSDTLAEKCLLEILSSNKSGNQSPKEYGDLNLDLNIFCGKLPDKKLTVDPDMHYLSKEKLTSTSKDVLLKRTHKDKCCKLFDVPNNCERALNLMVVTNSCNRNTFVYSVRQMNKFINRTIQMADATEISPANVTHFPREHFRQRSTFKIIDLNNNRVAKTEKMKNFSVQTREPMNAKQIKLYNDQILAIKNTALYLINNLDIEVKSHLKIQLERIGITDSFNLNLIAKEKFKDMEPKVIITELDSNDENKMVTKIKNQRKKKNNKKHRKSKLNLKLESNSVNFSSKQCFERLAYFMSTNQGLTQSKIMLEIEKEFKPIKDQISELRETMTDFVVVNHRINENGVKTSRLSVKPIDGAGQKLKSIFTISSASMQKLVLLAETSNKLPENFSVDVENEPTKLSPLAEMYIKLSRK